MQTMIYPIQHLPDKIPLGHQTEKGVTEIGFNVKPWLDAYEGIDLSVWPTRPGEAAAYPAADIRLVGTVLYWYPNETDTAIAGEGKVEIVGITGDKRKLSGWCGTSVKETSLGGTQDPPEGIKPYYEGIIDAAKDVKADVDVGDGGLFLVTGSGRTCDRTKEEIFAAVEAKKTVLFVNAHDGYVGTYTGKQVVDGIEAPTFAREVKYSLSEGGVRISFFYINPDGSVTWRTSTARTPNPYKIYIGGLDYDGSKTVNVMPAPADADAIAYLRWNGTQYMPATIDQLKQDLGLT